MLPNLTRLRILWPWMVAVLATVLVWPLYGWRGLALVVSALVLWVLLRLTRFLRIMQLAASQPKAYVDSAVMLHSRLKPGLSLLQVVAMTQTLGQPLSAADQQPEVFAWTDPGQTTLRCEFSQGFLSHWSLLRPDEHGVSPES